MRRSLQSIERARLRCSILLPASPASPASPRASRTRISNIRASKIRNFFFRARMMLPQVATGRHRLPTFWPWNLWNLLKYSRNLWKSMKIYQNPWKSLKTDANTWKSIKINDNPCKSMKIYENLWKSMENLVNLWKSLKSMKIDENHQIIKSSHTGEIGGRGGSL